MNSPTTPYCDATFLTTHNSFANAADGWVWYQQKDSIQSQLDAGVRAFMIDIWLETIGGNTDLYLLHGGWKLDWLRPKFQFRTLDDFMRQITDWLAQNPQEVVTVFFETGKTTKCAAGIRRVEQVMATYRSDLFDPQVGKGFATPIGQMKQRLVILSDYRGADTHSQNPVDQFGLPLVWHYCIETEYGDKSLEPDTWSNERPESADSRSKNRSLGLVNHFPSWVEGNYFLTSDHDLFISTVERRFFSDANSKRLLDNHVIDFKMKHGLVPNFVAVDMATIGDGPPQLVEYCESVRSNTVSTVRIQGINGEYMTTPDGEETNSLIYCRSGSPLTFEVVGSFDQCVLKVRGKDDLYLNYRGLTGAVKLYDDKSDANFRIEYVGNSTYEIYSIDESQYMWLDGDEPYITSAGASQDGRQFWRLEIDGAPPVREEMHIFETLTKSANYMTADDGLVADSLVNCRYNVPIRFEVWGSRDKCVLGVVGAKSTFLNYRAIGGALKLYDEPTLLTLKDFPGSPYVNIYSRALKEWLHFDKESGYSRFGRGPFVQGQWGCEKPRRRIRSFTITKISSAVNKKAMGAAAIDDNELIYCGVSGNVELEFVEIPGKQVGYVVPHHDLYLNYRSLTGAVKLYEELALFSKSKMSDGAFTLRSWDCDQLMWLDGDEPYVTAAGKSSKDSSHWILDTRVF